MCQTPIMIDNLNKGCYIRDPTLYYLKDTTSNKIPVPCGHCPSCLALKQNYFIQRIQCEAIDNHIFMAMLSYNNKHLPTLFVNGYKHKYADSRDIQLLMKRLRNEGTFKSQWRYWWISERGSKGHRPHWHGLFFVPKKKGDNLASCLTLEKHLFDRVLANWYTNLGSKRSPIKSSNLNYRKIYTSQGVKTNYDLHYVNPSLTDQGETDCAFYTSKYLLKDDDYTKKLKGALWHNLDEGTFSYYWSLLRHKTLTSHYVGDVTSPNVLSYLDFCIRFSLDSRLPYPCFINRFTGQTFPMSPYLRDLVITTEDLLLFRQNAELFYAPNSSVRLTPEIDVDKYLSKQKRFKKIQEHINFRDVHFDYFNNDYHKEDVYYEQYFKDTGVDKDTTSPAQDNFFDCGAADFGYTGF